MKKVLLLDKPPAAVITNGLSTPEDISIALLAMNKVMCGLIKRFKLELSLEDAANSEWKLQLQESSKRRQKIERTEEKRRKRKDLKTQKQLASKRQEWLEENNPNITEPVEDIVSTVKGWQVESIEIEEETPVEKTTSNNKSVKQKQSKNTADANQKEFIKANKQAAGKVKIENQKPLNSINASADNSFPKSKPKKLEEEQMETDQTETHVVDPFFITDTGENYLSSAVSIANDKWQQQNGQEDDKRNLHLIKLNGKNKPTYHQQDFKTNKFGARNQFSSQKYDKSQKFGTEDKFSNYANKKSKELTNSRQQNIHPSWAAKQKLKPVISSFQGKKITFEDNDDNGSTAPRASATTANQSYNKNPHANKMEESNLHPSWLAKQKLKPSITEFKGKKITFDNDNE